MHPEALRGVQWALQDSGVRVPLDHHWADVGILFCLDVGGADVNGSARRIVDTATRRVNRWLGLDIAPGAGVDIVCDARKPVADTEREAFDFVLCTEVFEHVDDWAAIVFSIFDWLKPGGTAVMTCASTGRRPHGARGAMDPAAGEHYGNVPELHLLDALKVTGFTDYRTKYQAVPGDVYAWGRKAD
jgi:SAM-dependent methyltransferase